MVGKEDVGSTVVWYSKHGCRFGKLLEAGHKWAYVNLEGRRRKLPVAELRTWPRPAPVDSKPAKRGR